MNIQDAIRQYADSFQIISAYFDNKPYGFADDMTHYYWEVDKITEKSLNFDERNFDEVDEPTYSEEISLFIEKEDYSLVLLNSCTGDNYFAILDNKKRIRL